MSTMMKAAVFVERGRIELADKPVPTSGPTTRWSASPRPRSAAPTCTSSRRVSRCQGPHRGSRAGRRDREAGQRRAGLHRGPARDRRRHLPELQFLCGQDGVPSQDGSYLIASGRCGCHGYKATAGWRFGNLIDGTQAEYVLVPDAQANLAPIPDGLTRRAGADVPGHHVHRLQGRREREHQDRRHRGGLRAGPDRTVRHRRRATARREHHHRRGRQRPPPGHREDGCRHHARTSSSATSSTRS